MKITIYNYLNKPRIIELPSVNSFEEIERLEVTVLSGDEVITVYTKDGNKHSFDAHVGSKHILICYGNYTIDNFPAFSEWSSIKPDNNDVASFKRMFAMETYGVKVSKPNYCEDPSSVRRFACVNAIKHFGTFKQQDKALEEMHELGQAILKFRNHEDVIEHVAEEIADVEIMIEQLRMMFGIDEMIAWKKELKIRRLLSKITDEREKGIEDLCQ